MFRLGRIFAGVAIWMLVSSVAVGADNDVDGRSSELKAAAVERLAHSLNPALPIALGKAAVRQAALVHARELLASYGRRAKLGSAWNREVPEWKEAEADLMQEASHLIDRTIQNPDWFYTVLAREIGRTLNAEEADYVASHFTTWSGKEQRIMLEMRVISEVLMANYTFTNRIDHTIPGLEADLRELSEAYWENEPFRKRDFMNDPQAVKFAGRAAGLKFTRMLAINGIEGFIAHIDARAAEARAMVDNAEPVIEPYIAAYRRRTGAGN